MATQALPPDHCFSASAHALLHQRRIYYSCTTSAFETFSGENPIHRLVLGKPLYIGWFWHRHSKLRGNPYAQLVVGGVLCVSIEFQAQYVPYVLF